MGKGLCPGVWGIVSFQPEKKEDEMTRKESF